MATAERVRAAFRAQDAAKTGLVDRSTLASFLAAAGGLDSRQVEALLAAGSRRGQSDKEPLLAYDDFVDFIFGLNPGSSRAEEELSIRVLAMDGSLVCALPSIPRACTTAELRAEVVQATGFREEEFVLTLGTLRLLEGVDRPLAQCSSSRVVVLHLVRKVPPEDLDVLYASVGGAWLIREHGRLSLDFALLGRFPEARRAGIFLALTVDGRLRHLSLVGNELGDEGAELAAQVLERSPTLLSLDLARNLVGDAGAERLRASLRQRASAAFALLDLSGNPIGGATLRALQLAARVEQQLEIKLPEAPAEGFESES